MSLFNRHLFLSVLLVISSTATAVEDSQFIQFSNKNLEKGRSVWMDNCKNCHAYGAAGAPIPMQQEDWKGRVEKKTSVLYDHAINGFFGPDDSMMPERGGNPDLSDEQVKQAVDYMVALAKYYLAK